jgi:large subunit ribosomal protein L18
VTAYEPTGDRVLAAAESRELGQVGFPLSARVSTPASYLTGYLAGLRAKARGATQAVLDTGLRRPSPGGRILGALQGLLDAGIFIPHGKSAFPPIERLSGTHLEHKLPKPIEVYKADLAQSLGRTPPEGA